MTFPSVSPNAIPLNIVGGTKFARYKQMTTEETVNMLVTGSDSGVPALVPYAGYEKVLDFGRGEARGLFLSTRLNELIAIFGSSVFVITDFLGSRRIGTLDSSSGPVHISENFNQQIAIEDGTKIYIYDYGASTFTKPSIDFVPVYIDFQDSYFIATDNDGNWHLSETNNGNVWPPLDTQTLQTKSDILQAAVVLDRQLWIMGQKASEIWYDQGLQIFPYVRENSLSIDYGALSRETIAEGFGRLVWLAKNEKSQPTIVYTDGGRPKPISTEGLSFTLSQLTKPEDSVGFLYQQDGHIFYQLTFPTDNFSIVYDFNTNLFYTLTDECRNRHIAKQVVLFNNTLYFISLIDSKLYKMSTDITTYDGEEIPRFRITHHFRYPDNRIFIVNRVSLQMEQGNNDSISKVGLSLSKDAGVTFGNVHIQDINSQGNRRGNVNFWRMGRSNVITFQLEFWSKDRFVVTEGTMDIYQ